MKTHTRGLRYEEKISKPMTQYYSYLIGVVECGYNNSSNDGSSSIATNNPLPQIRGKKGSAIEKIIYEVHIKIHFCHSVKYLQIDGFLLCTARLSYDICKNSSISLLHCIQTDALECAHWLASKRAGTSANTQLFSSFGWCDCVFGGTIFAIIRSTFDEIYKTCLPIDTIRIIVEP